MQILKLFIRQFNCASVCKQINFDGLKVIFFMVFFVTSFYNNKCSLVVTASLM